MTGNVYTGIDPRFTDSVLSVLRFVCQTKTMVAEEDRTAINDGLVRICEQNDVIALGEMVQSLARDVVLVLRYSYEEDPACASMAVKIEEAEGVFAVLLNEVRRRFTESADISSGEATGPSPEAVFWVGGGILPESGRGRNLNHLWTR